MQPMPTRKFPYRIFEAHEINDKLDLDGTVPADPTDWDEEHRRHTRNLTIEKQLQKGLKVQYKSSGW